MPTLPIRVDELAPAQAREVVGDPALRQAGPIDQFGHTVRACQQVLEDGQPGRVSQQPEPSRLRDGHRRPVGFLGIPVSMRHMPIVGARMPRRRPRAADGSASSMTAGAAPSTGQYLNPVTELRIAAAFRLAVLPLLLSVQAM